MGGGGALRRGAAARRACDEHFVVDGDALQDSLERGVGVFLPPRRPPDLRAGAAPRSRHQRRALRVGGGGWAGLADRAGVDAAGERPAGGVRRHGPGERADDERCGGFGAGSRQGRALCGGSLKMRSSSPRMTRLSGTRPSPACPPGRGSPRTPFIGANTVPGVRREASLCSRSESARAAPADTARMQRGGTTDSERLTLLHSLRAW